MQTSRMKQKLIKTTLYFSICPLLILLTACATPKDFQSLMKKNPTSDNNYTAGYLDGCDSGLSTRPETADRLFFQDIIRYNADPKYAAGWESGYKICSR